MMNHSISYIASESDKPFFFTPRLIETVNQLSHALDKTDIKIYPDATLKTNRLPTGILCKADFYSTYLFPFILRDPGCGFLNFKIHFHQQPETNWQHTIGKKLNYLFNQATIQEKAQWVILPEIEQMIQDGIDAYPLNTTQRKKFFHPKFSIDSEINLSKKQLESLQAERLNITNTLEIRILDDARDKSLLSAQNINSNDLIGFIHSGSVIFPEILANTFTHRIAEYCFDHSFYTCAQINSGFFGIPLFCELGKTYQNWLNAAMNFAVANRYASFLMMKHFLENTLACQVELINDRMHAGLFIERSETSEHYFMSRGVQPIPVSDRDSPHNLTLHAGHRETIAALVTGMETANWTAHGSGECILENGDYPPQYFEQQKIARYLQWAKDAYYNTVPAFHEFLPLTFNTLRAIASLEYRGICQKVAILLPLINIHGQLLIG